MRGWTLLDHRVGAGKHRRRDRETERFRGFKIDGEFEPLISLILAHLAFCPLHRTQPERPGI